MVFGFGKSTRRPVAEHEAEGETERIYHEIRQTLRVTGVNLIFRAWASYDRFFPVLWNALAPNLETMAFEEAADRLRAEGTRLAERLGKLDLASRIRLGESQAFQLSGSIDVFHYVNPKLLLISSAVRLALEGEPIGRRLDGNGRLVRIELGAPTSMFPMEMVPENTDDRRTRGLFDDIRRTMAMESVNSDYRTLALWPDYLAAAWEMLKPLMKREQYLRATDELRDLSRALVRTLPYPIPLSKARIAEVNESPDELVELTVNMERILAPLIVNMALVALDWKTTDVLARSPFPAEPRRHFEQVQGGVS